MALASSLERWGLVEAGARFGRVKMPAGGRPRLRGVDRPGGDALRQPRARHPRRPGLAGARPEARRLRRVEPRRARRGARVLAASQAEGRAGRPLGPRLVAQVDGLAGFSGDDLPVYDWYRLGGVELLPGLPPRGAEGRPGPGRRPEPALPAGRPAPAARARRRRQRVRPHRRHQPRRPPLGRGRRASTTPARSAPSRSRSAVRDGGSTLATLSVGWN